MHKAQEYREHARRCELLLARVQDPRIRLQLRRERQEWLDLAASREAALRQERWAGERALDEDMTLSSLRAFEAGRGKRPRPGRRKKDQPGPGRASGEASDGPGV
jgi:hypothetical protein